MKLLTTIWKIQKILPKWTGSLLKYLKKRLFFDVVKYHKFNTAVTGTAFFGIIASHRRPFSHSPGKHPVFVHPETV
jgi:hypothetical protein